MEASGQFTIRWNNYSTVLQNFFPKLLEDQHFVDVTLTCEGQSIKCHRLILSACSTYFDRILKDNPSPHLVIFLTTTKFWELKALVKFMYFGEVSISSQQKLQSLCKAAKTLRVKGLPYVDEDDMDDDDDDCRIIEVKKNPLQPQPKNNTNCNGPIQHCELQRSALPLRQYNNLSSYAAVQTNGQLQQIKRKIPMQLPKPVKMQRVGKKLTNEAGNSVGENPKIQQLPVNEIPVKIPDTVETIRSSIPQVNENYENEEGVSMQQHDGTTDASINYVCDVGNAEDNEEMDDGDGNDLGSKEDDCNFSMKYKKVARDSKTAFEFWKALRQYSPANGNNSKTKMWKRISREEYQDGDEDATTSNMTMESEGGGGGSMSGTGIQPPERQRMGSPVDPAERAERLRKASQLAISGLTVRKAAALFEIPRTTLCAYMKRHGLVATRNSFIDNSAGFANYLKQPSQEGESSEASSTAETGNDQDVGNSSGNSILDFPFPFLDISQGMDELSQGRYENEDCAQGEEEDMNS